MYLYLVFKIKHFNLKIIFPILYLNKNYYELLTKIILYNETTHLFPKRTLLILDTALDKGGKRRQKKNMTNFILSIQK